ncbi:MAG TPA: hypothetical protein VFX58_06895 [Chitinophagaceae bacterium]|nr:hypothetical protein [Chitinophagaceae bacterium]
MNSKPELEKKIQQVLDSLDGIQRAEPRPFFYTRVLGRLQADEKTIWETMGSFLSRPVVAVAGLCVILILNGFILFQQEKESGIATPIVNSNEIVTDNEYILASSSSFEYENMDQQ